MIRSILTFAAATTATVAVAFGMLSGNAEAADAATQAVGSFTSAVEEEVVAFFVSD